MSDELDLARVGLVLGLILVAMVVPVAAATTIDAGSGTSYETDSGFTLTITSNHSIDNSNPFITTTRVKLGTAEVGGTNGSANASSISAIDGATSTLVDVDPSGGRITVDPANRGALTIKDPASSVEFNDFSIDDSETDITVSASNTVDLTLQGLASGLNFLAVNATSGATVDSATATQTGIADITLPSGTTEVRLQSVPGDLIVRDIKTKKKVTNAENATVNFFNQSATVTVRDVVNGSVDMTGLPKDERFIAKIEATNYSSRNVIVPSVIQQSNVYLLPDSADTVEPRIKLDDPTGQFDEQRSTITLSRPIKVNNQTRFVAVAGDRVGANGYDTVLETDQVYRVTVRDPGGQTTRVGEFTPTLSETVTFTISEIEYRTTRDTDGVETSFGYDNSSSPPTIDVGVEGAESVSINISDSDNSSNVLLNSSFSGDTTVSEPVPTANVSDTFLVQIEATKSNGETVTVSRLISSDSLQTPGSAPIDDDWKAIFSMIGLVVLGGLFSRANAGVGAVVVASVGGMLWLAGWMPAAASGITVAVALIVAGLAYALSRRSV